MVDFFYSGQLIVTRDSVTDLLRIADLLMLESTRNSLLKFLQQTLNSENCIWYKSLGETFNCSPVVDAAQRFIIRNFEDVSKTPDFTQLSAADLKSLISSK